MSQINNNNFFRWYSGSVIDEQSVNIPRLGIADAKSYLPQLVSGEQTGFYINSDIPFYDGDQVSDLELRLTDGTVIGNVMQAVVLQTGYRLYAAFTVPVLATGQYQYEIYNTSTLTTKCISNYFQVIDAATAGLYTCSVKWRNSRDSFYYDWSVVPDFYCQLRLNLSLESYTPEGTVDQTKAVSTGTRRNNNYDLDFSVKLQTYYFDDGANMACIPLFIASYIEINGRTYINKTLYSPNVRVNSKVNIGEIELYDQPFSRINKYGQLPQLVLKTGKYVLINNTAVAFTVHKYSSADVLLSESVVDAHSTLTIDINDFQINSYLNLTAASPGSYGAITARSLPNGTFTYSINTITTTDPTNTITQNQVYGNDYFVAISDGGAPSAPIVNLNVTEPTTPFADANGLVKINGVDQPAINSTGSASYTVADGDSIEGIAFAELSPDEPCNLHLNIKKDGVDIYEHSTSNVPGANINNTFTAEAGSTYDITVNVAFSG